MNSFIRIIRHPYEEPHHLNLVVVASDGQVEGSLEIYENAIELTEIADRLENFPKDCTDQYLWELGSKQPDDNFAFYFRLNVSQMDSTGNCSIQICMKNNSNVNQNDMIDISISASKEEINLLGKLFREFAKLENTELEWTIPHVLEFK